MNPPRWSSKCTWAHIFWHFIFLSSFVFKKENKGEDYYSQTLQNFGVAKGWMRGKVYVCVHRHVWACMHVRYVRQERTIVFVYEVVSLFPVASPFMILLLIKTILLRRLPRPSFLGGMAWPHKEAADSFGYCFGWSVSPVLVDNKEEKRYRLFAVSVQISLPPPNTFLGLIVSPEHPGSLLKLP